VCREPSRRTVVDGLRSLLIGVGSLLLAGKAMADQNSGKAMADQNPGLSGTEQGRPTGAGRVTPQPPPGEEIPAEKDNIPHHDR